MPNSAKKFFKDRGHPSFFNQNWQVDNDYQLCACLSVAKI